MIASVLLPTWRIELSFHLNSCSEKFGMMAIGKPRFVLMAFTLALRAPSQPVTADSKAGSISEPL